MRWKPLAVILKGTLGCRAETVAHSPLRRPHPRACRQSGETCL